VSLPRSAGAQPYSYLHPILGGDSEITSADSTPARPFGFGLSYTSFTRTDLRVASEVRAGAAFTATVRVRNSGDRAGVDVVQLYGRDVIGSVTRPVAQLLAYARVELAPGEEAEVEVELPPTRLAFTDRRMRRVVEPGEVELWAGPSCADREASASLLLTGETYELTAVDARTACVSVRRLPAS